MLTWSSQEMPASTAWPQFYGAMSEDGRSKHGHFRLAGYDVANLGSCHRHLPGDSDWPPG